MKKLISVLLVLVMLIPLIPFEAMAAEDYVCVGGVELTSGEYLANGATEPTKTRPTGGVGYALYRNGVLTLQDYEYSGIGSIFSYKFLGDTTYYHAAIARGWDDSQDLKIVLEGENKISVIEGNDYESYGIRHFGPSTSEINISGSGSLEINAEYGIDCGQPVVLDGANLDIYATNTGIQGSLYDPLEIKNSNVRIHSESDGIAQLSTVKITNSVMYIEAKLNGIEFLDPKYFVSDRTVNIESSDVTVKSTATNNDSASSAVWSSSEEDVFDFMSTCSAVASTSSNGSSPVAYDFDNTNDYDWVHITPADIVVGGYALADGMYLSAGDMKYSTQKPTSGYAYYNDGVLLLSDFYFEGNSTWDSEDKNYRAMILSKGSLLVQLEGLNTIDSTLDDTPYNRQEGAENVYLIASSEGSVALFGSGELRGRSESGIYGYSGVEISDCTFDFGPRAALITKAIYAPTGDVTISGSNVNIKGNNGKGIEAITGNVNISSSNVSVATGDTAIRVSKGDLTVEDSTVNATSLGLEAIAIANGDIVVEDSTVLAAVNNGNEAISAGYSCSFIHDTVITVSDSFDGKDSKEISGNDIAGEINGRVWVKFGTGEVEAVFAPIVWVGGIGLSNGQYLSSNSRIVLKDQPYDNYVGLKDGVLTFCNYSYTGPGLIEVYVDNGSAAHNTALYSAENISINVVGNNTLTVSTNASLRGYKTGILIDNDLVMTGNGTLTVNARYGICNFSSGVNTITDTSLFINAELQGVYCKKNITIENGNININIEKDTEDYKEQGIDASALTIKDSVVFVSTPHNGIFGGMYVENSTVKAVCTIAENGGYVLGNGDAIDLGDGLEITVSSNPDGSDPVEYFEEDHTAYKYLLIENTSGPCFIRQPADIEVYAKQEYTISWDVNFVPKQVKILRQYDKKSNLTTLDDPTQNYYTFTMIQLIDPEMKVLVRAWYGTGNNDFVEAEATVTRLMGHRVLGNIEGLRDYDMATLTLYSSTDLLLSNPLYTTQSNYNTPRKYQFVNVNPGTYLLHVTADYSSDYWAFVGVGDSEDVQHNVVLGWQLKGTVYGLDDGMSALVEVYREGESTPAYKIETVPTTGEFSFGNVPDGDYTVRVTAPGFKPYVDDVKMMYGTVTMSCYMQRLPKVSIGGIALSDGQYLANGATSPTSTAPSNSSVGYAYYSDGILVLNNYYNENTNSVIRFYTEFLTLDVRGNCLVGSICDGFDDANMCGNLWIQTYEDSGITFMGNSDGNNAPIEVHGQLTFAGKGEIIAMTTGNVEGPAIRDTEYLIVDGPLVMVAGTYDFGITGTWEKPVYIEIDEGMLMTSGSLCGVNEMVYISSNTNVFGSTTALEIDMSKCKQLVKGEDFLRDYKTLWITPPAEEFYVTFKVEGYDDYVVPVPEGMCVAQPPVPPAADGYTFLGWYTEGGQKYDFSKPVTGDITLIAKFKKNVSGDVLIGDVNLDGQVNSIDSNLLKRSVAGEYIIESGSPAALNADINGDGQINSIDSNLLKRMVAGDYRP